MGWMCALSWTGLLFMASVSLAGAEPGHRTGDQALIAAAERNDVEAVRQLLKEGASVRARDPQGRTALLAATYRNHVASRTSRRRAPVAPSSTGPSAPTR